MAETTGTAPTASNAHRTARLELVKEMPRGSIGVVYKARNPELDRFVALRQFQVPQWLDDVNELLKQVVAQAKLASALQHTNIGRLYTCGYKEFTVFMTTEFIEAPSLREHFAGRLPEISEALALMRQLCAALDYAHEKGVYHHFLNPANIRVLPDGTIKILDFGLLKDKNLLSQTPAKKLENEPYFSPEQVRGRPVDRAGNLFTAAGILYEILTSRSPFGGRHLGEVDRNITDVDPHPLTISNPRVSEAMSKAVLKALSKNPADRFQSGAQLMEALDTASKEPARVAPSTAPKTGQMPAAAANGSGQTGAFSTTTTTAAATATAMAPVKTASVPAQTTTVVRPARKGGLSNDWKLVAAIVGCLFVLGILGILLRHKPVSTTDESATVEQPAAAAPASTPAPPAAAPVTSAPAAPEAQAPKPDIAADTTSAAADETPEVTVKPGKSAKGRNKKGKGTVAAAPVDGSLFINSTPAGATIEIQGKSGVAWKTPNTINSLTPGTYKLTISKLGFATETRSVDVTAGNKATVDVRLTATKGILTVATDPAGASIAINGKDTGRVSPADFMMDPGAATVTMHKTGFLDASTQVKVVAGQTTTITPSLRAAGNTDTIKTVGGLGKMFGGGSTKGMGHISIKTDPKGAEIIINGKVFDKTTPVELVMEPGNYDITLKKDGYKPVQKSISVNIDDKLKVEETLQK